MIFFKHPLIFEISLFWNPLLSYLVLGTIKQKFDSQVLVIKSDIKQVQVNEYYIIRMYICIYSIG